MRQPSSLHIQDWQHRLLVLWAWRKWKFVNTSDRDDGATYRAVLDGCAITIRALCDILGVRCDFRNKLPSDGPDRFEELLRCCNNEGIKYLEKLEPEIQSCLLEVLYLANRAIAHPQDGLLDHKVTRKEMTSAVNTVLDWLKTKESEWPELKEVDQDFLTIIS